MRVYEVYVTEKGHDALYYDCTYGGVVVAENARHARRLMESGTTGDNPDGFWLDPKMAKCRAIGQALGKNRKARVVMRDFLAG
jgi:hypothetical protein